jgi:hypothetical protein
LAVSAGAIGEEVETLAQIINEKGGPITQGLVDKEFLKLRESL